MRPIASDRFARASGRRKTEPAEARTTLGLNGLTVPSPKTTPPAPKASADRSIVPRFPGSCTPAMANSGPPAALANTSSRVKSFHRTRAATPCGASLGTTLANSLSGSRSVSTWAPSWGRKPLCPGRGRLAEKDCLKAQAAANGFFQNSQAFNGAVPLRGELAAGEGPAQLFDQSIVASLDAAQAGANASSAGCGAWAHAVRVRSE